MELKFIKYEKRGHLAYITLNRPEVTNALHPPCHLEMDQVWDDFAGDREMWVAILTGAGERAFSRATILSGPPSIAASARR
jgi:dehydration protein DpgD